MLSLSTLSRVRVERTRTSKFCAITKYQDIDIISKYQNIKFLEDDYKRIKERVLLAVAAKSAFGW
jgi:peroxiredoxin